MNDDAIYKLYCMKYLGVSTGKFDDEVRKSIRLRISKTLKYKFYKLRIRLWSFYMVFRGMFLNLFFGVKRFFR